MGQLKSGVSLIYERDGDTVYQREVGADPATRSEVGWEYDPITNNGRPLREEIKEAKLWGDIRRAAPTNPALQDALERVIMIYHLTKTK